MMKTSDVEKETGLTKHTIRYYEKEGLLAIKRDENGYRDYHEEDIHRLKAIKFLRNLNISIDDVKGIINGEVDFQECLKINQIHLEKHIENLKEIKKSIDYYHHKDMPSLSSLSEIELKPYQAKLGFQKTTNAISLGRKLTQPLALRRILYTLIPALFFGLFGIIIFDPENIVIKIIVFIVSALLIQFIMIASSLQLSTLYLGDTIDHTMNQSIEFLSDGIRCYQFTGLISHLKYFFAVLWKKDDHLMHIYRYEDIQEVIIDVKKRYVKIAIPLAQHLYVPDFTFVFCDQKRFYFCWPMTLDDDMRFIATILEEKVKNIKDSKNVLYALKNGIQLNDYLEKK